MPWTSNDLANIDKAIASAEKMVRFGDREVSLRAVDELKAARTEILNYLSSQGGTPPVRIVRIYTGSGW